LGKYRRGKDREEVMRAKNPQRVISGTFNTKESKKDRREDDFCRNSMIHKGKQVKNGLHQGLPDNPPYEVVKRKRERRKASKRLKKTKGEGELLGPDNRNGKRRNIRILDCLLKTWGGRVGGRRRNCEKKRRPKRGKESDSSTRGTGKVSVIRKDQVPD